MRLGVTDRSWRSRGGEAAREKRGDLGTRLIDGSRHAEVRELGDRKSWVAAGIDVGIGRKVHGDVDREAVIGATAVHLQPEGRNLCLALPGRGINPGSGRFAVRLDA